MNDITMKLNADNLIKMALQEDISSEDVTTNAVMRNRKQGEVQLICKQDGIIAGLGVFERVFKLLDETTEVEFYAEDGDGSNTWRHPCASFRRAYCAELFAENERNCDLYTSDCRAFKRNKNQAFRHQKNNSEHAYF